jgi:hypothetical protein
VPDPLVLHAHQVRGQHSREDPHLPELLPGVPDLDLQPLNHPEPDRVQDLRDLPGRDRHLHVLQEQALDLSLHERVLIQGNVLRDRDHPEHPGPPLRQISLLRNSLPAIGSSLRDHPIGFDEYLEPL